MKKRLKPFVEPEFPEVKPEVKQELISTVEAARQKGKDCFEKITWTSFGGIGGEETSLTGSKHLIEAIRKTGESVRILLDCGMFQGKGKERNQTLPVKPSTIQHVIETHMHLDHFGLLPLLTKNEEEFTGEIHCTPVTWEGGLI